MDIFRNEFRTHYVLALINTIIVFLAMIIVFTLPRWTNMFYYYNSVNISDSDISIYKILSMIADALFLCAWMIGSGSTKSSITDMDLDPEEELDEEFYVEDTGIGE